jgi:hypothetical protein
MQGPIGTQIGTQARRLHPARSRVIDLIRPLYATPPAQYARLRAGPIALADLLSRRVPGPQARAQARSAGGSGIVRARDDRRESGGGDASDSATSSTSGFPLRWRARAEWLRPFPRPRRS